MINNSSPTSVRPEHSRGALAQTDNMRPSTSLGTNETGTTAKREELKKAAEAFEAIFMRQMIGSMRQAGLAEDVFGSRAKIGRAHVCTPVTTAHIVCRLLLEKKKQHTLTKVH